MHAWILFWEHIVVQKEGQSQQKAVYKRMESGQGHWQRALLGTELIGVGGGRGRATGMQQKMGWLAGRAGSVKRGGGACIGRQAI